MKKLVLSFLIMSACTLTGFAQKSTSAISTSKQSNEVSSPNVKSSAGADFRSGSTAEPATKKNAAPRNQDVIASKQKAAKDCKELNDQLSKLFGSSYSIADPKVIAQLQKNVNDVSVSYEVRKSSLYAVYGDNYTEHAKRLTNNK